MTVENWKATLGARMKKAREDADLTQAFIATDLNVAQTTVSAWERGVAAPRDDLRPRIAQLLGVAANWLFSYDPDNGDDEDGRAA